MVDSITRVTHQSYGSRLGKSMKGMIFGPVLLIAGIWLLVRGSYLILLTAILWLVIHDD